MFLAQLTGLLILVLLAYSLSTNYYALLSILLKSNSPLSAYKLGVAVVCGIFSTVLVIYFGLFFYSDTLNLVYGAISGFSVGFIQNINRVKNNAVNSPKANNGNKLKFNSIVSVPVLSYILLWVFIGVLSVFLLTQLMGSFYVRVPA